MSLVAPFYVDTVYKHTCITYRVFQKKIAQSLRHHSSATVRHRVMRFSIKCSEINYLHDKGQRLNTAIKYSLFCSWQVNYSKTKLTGRPASLRQIRDRNKVHAKIMF